MKVLTYLLLAALLLAACGGEATPESNTPDAGEVEQEAEPSPTVAQDSEAEAAPATATPDNSVSTPEADALNDSFATAIALGDEPIEASVKESVLYYSLDVPAGGVVTATLTVKDGSPAPATLTLYNMVQNYLEDVSVPVGESGTIDYSFDRTQRGTVFLAVNGESNFALEGSTGTQNDGGSSEDAGDERTDAILVEPGDYTGLLGDEDRNDYYALELPESGGTVEASLTARDGEITMYLYDQDANYVTEVSDSGGGEPATLQHVMAAGEGGTWYLAFAGSGAYQFSVAFGAQDDAGSGGDAGDEARDAVEIEPGEYSGILGNDDAIDYYAFEVPDTGVLLEISLEAEVEDESLAVYLYDSDENYITEGNTAGGEEPVSLQLVVAVGEGGAWYLQVTGVGAYRLSVSLAGQDDAGSGGDAPGELEDALPVPVGEEIRGVLGDSDSRDSYIVEAPGGSYTLMLSGESDDLAVYVYDAEQNYLTEGVIGDISEGLPIESSTDNFYIELMGSGVYTLQVDTP